MFPILLTSSIYVDYIHLNNLTMNTHYNIFKSNPLDDSIISMGRVYHYDEVQPTIETFKTVHPECKFFYETVNTSTIKSGFGRDPDLH